MRGAPDQVTRDGRRLRTQVIGLRSGRVLSTPLEETGGLQLGDPIVVRKEDARVEVGRQLLSRVLVGAMSRQHSADVSVIALVGERNPEIRDLLEHELSPGGVEAQRRRGRYLGPPRPVRIRAGQFQSGSITGFFTILVEGHDFNEPICDAVRSILDGHIVLSRDLGAALLYPAVELLNSVSRLAARISTPDQKAAALKLRGPWPNIGPWRKPGSSA